MTDSDLLKTNEGPQSQEILNFVKTISSFPSDVSLSNLAILLNKYYGTLSGSVDGYSLTSPYQNLGEKLKNPCCPKPNSMPAIPITSSKKLHYIQSFAIKPFFCY